MASFLSFLGLNPAGFNKALVDVRSNLRGFKQSAQKDGAGLSQAIFGGLTKTLAGVGAAIGGVKIAQGVGGVFKDAIGRAADAEQMEVSMSVLIGDTDQAKKTLADLRKLGAETPMEFPELADAGRSLIAFGESAASVPNTLKRIGDIASGINQPIGEIAELYGKARVQGRLFGEDINQLTGRGIPIIQELAKQFGVAESEVKKLVESGQVNFQNLEQAFTDLTAEGGKFGGMMAMQSKTLSGLWSTLQDNLGNLLLTFGQPIADQLRPMLAEAIGLLGSAEEMAKSFGAAIGNALSYVVATFQELGSGDLLNIISSGLKIAFQESVNVLWAGLWGTVQACGQYLIEYFGIAVKGLSIIKDKSFWSALWEAVKGIGYMLGAAMSEALAAASREMAKIPGIGWMFEDAEQGFMDQAKWLSNMASEQMPKGADMMRPYLHGWQAQAAEAGKNIAGAFQRGYEGTDKIFDTSELSKGIGTLNQRVRDRMQASKQDAASKEKSGATAAGPQAPVLPAVARHTRPGVFASAVNLLMGRSANELILDESKKQTQQMESMNRRLESIEKNTSNQNKIKKPQDVRVEVVPKFA